LIHKFQYLADNFRMATISYKYNIFFHSNLIEVWMRISVSSVEI
jgi:hypothetical protein